MIYLVDKDGLSLGGPQEFDFANKQIHTMITYIEILC